jgi:hypothetical protein
MTADRPTFARHESFYPRVGWLWKAVKHSQRMPEIFLRDDATVELGVGKNMVRAIRYWGLATRVLEEYTDPGQPRRALARPTAFGRLLLGAEGWDPYLEDPRSVWLLHWALIRPPTAATAWQRVLGHWSRTDFAENEAVSWLREQVSREPGWPNIAEHSIRRDIQCILQMYGPPRSHGKADDIVESPFRDITLLSRSPGDHARWRFVYGLKPGLSPAIVAFTCLDFASRESSGTTMTISRLALEPYSPGLVLRLSETQIIQALEAVAATHPALNVIAPAGVSQLVFSGNALAIAWEILATDYGHKTPRSQIDDVAGSLASAHREAA